ncbi:MAG: hypothetical protein AB8H79_00090 [Myxococcota bacterium]
MRHGAWVMLAWVVGCTAGTAEVQPVKVEFREVQGVWALAPADEGQTHVQMSFEQNTLDFGLVPGSCAPTSELPFTEVQTQKAMAALKCTSADGGSHDVVIVEVTGNDPDWPAPVALGMVMSRVTGEDQVSLVTMGGKELPLGVIPKAPK